MVNLWPGVPAKYLCDKHLNAVLAEYHNKLLPSMRKGHSIEGYLRHGCFDLTNGISRIQECLLEANIRGHKWKYLWHSRRDDEIYLYCTYQSRYEASNPKFFLPERQVEMAKMNKMILSFRCPDCRKRIEAYREKNHE